MTKNIFRFCITTVLILFPCASAQAAPYPSFEEMAAEVRAIAESHPDLVTYSEIGKSVEGRPIMALHIALPGDDSRPEALIAGNIHGNEYIGNRMAVAVARRIADGNGTDAWVTELLKKMDFWILPCINPDGYVATWGERGKLGPERKVRHNANGVDLNRNFPLPSSRTIAIEMAGSRDKDSVYYMGPEPYSEPETRAVRDFVSGRRFFADIDFHSAYGVIFPPKCPNVRCVRMFREMFKDALKRQKTRAYAVVMVPQGDTYTGEMEDMLYYDHGILAVCWEIYPDSEVRKSLERTHDWFYGNNPEPDDVDTWIENDRDAAIAAIEKAFELTGGKPVPADMRVAK